MADCAQVKQLDCEESKMKFHQKPDHPQKFILELERFEVEWLRAYLNEHPSKLAAANFETKSADFKMRSRFVTGINFKENQNG